MNASNVSIKIKALGLFGLMLLTSLALAASAVILLKQQEADGVVVNIAGRQRMLSQKMTKETLQLLAADKPQADARIRKALLGTAALFDRSLNGLINGNAAMGLPPAGDPAIKAQLTVVKRLWRPFLAAVKTAAAEPGKGSANFRRALSVLTSSNIRLLKEMNKAVGMFADAAGNKVKLLLVVMYIGAAASLLVFVFSWLALGKAVIKPLKTLLGDVQKMAGGDLRPAGRSLGQGDEIVSLTGSVERMRLDWAKIVKSIAADSETVASVSRELSASNQDLNQRTQQQAAAVEETASAVEQMTSSVKQNAENAAQANELARGTSDMARKGASSSELTIKAMDEVSASSQKIGEITSVVNEIAFQTNLLALNAAVEAARAGEAGRGFAVVAGEVRNLAGRSAAAAKEIQNLIADTMHKVDQGAEMVSQSGRLLTEIIENVQRVADTVEEISTANHEQAVGVEEVNRAIAQMDAAVQQNAALVEQAASSSDNLAGVAQQLRAQVKQFKLEQGPDNGGAARG